MDSTGLVQRVPCAECGALILPITAARNAGKCMPCHNKEKYAQLHAPADSGVRSIEEEIEELKKLPRDTIRNCEIQFRFQCPRVWEKLEVTDENDIRFCDTCRQKVYFCHNDAEAVAHARSQHCVAMHSAKPAARFLVQVGMVAVENKLTPEQEEAVRAYNHDKTMTKALKEARYATRYCAACGIPCPDWYERCLACGHAVGILKNDNAPFAEPNSNSD